MLPARGQDEILRPRKSKNRLGGGAQNDNPWVLARNLWRTPPGRVPDGLLSARLFFCLMTSWRGQEMSAMPGFAKYVGLILMAGAIVAWILSPADAGK
jgi:hypothetical protein